MFFCIERNHWSLPYVWTRLYWNPLVQNCIFQQFNKNLIIKKNEEELELSCLFISTSLVKPVNDDVDDGAGASNMDVEPLPSTSRNIDEDHRVSSDQEDFGSTDVVTPNTGKTYCKPLSGCPQTYPSWEVYCFRSIFSPAEVHFLTYTSIIKAKN